MKMKIKKLHEDSIIPKYQSRGASGFDLHALEEITLEAGETKLIRTGLAFEIPEGFELQIRPRSGLSLKTKLRISNAPGTLDADFRGEACVIMENTNNTFYSKNGDRKIVINKGDRIAQGVICPIFQAEFIEDELTSTERGSGAFGHTGV